MDPEEAALAALAEELYGTRRLLLRFLVDLPDSGSVVDLQRKLLDEHARKGTTRAERDLFKHHRIKLRAIGDALAWLLLPAHTIRTLSKHPGRAAPPPMNAEDAAFVMQVVEQLFRAGRVPVISDLTNVLLVGDVVAVESGGSVEVVECKNTRIPVRPPASGRLARQRQRGEMLTRYLRESVMPHPQGSQAAVAAVADALAIPRPVGPSPAIPELVAMDVALPEPNPEWLAAAYTRYEESPQGVGLVEIGAGDYLLITERNESAVDQLGDVLQTLPPLRQVCVSMHFEQLNQPLPHCRSILSYPLDWEFRAALLESDLVMVRVVDLSIFEEPDDDGVGLTLRDGQLLQWTHNGYHQVFSNRFIDEVMYGPVSAAAMRSCLIDCVRRAERDVVPLVMDTAQISRVNELDRGSGSSVRYATVYPSNDGDLAIVGSAVDAGLDMFPEVTHTEYFPSSRRLIVYADEDILLDTEVPVAD
ncbi:hypothetical protein [Actinoplanes couchii]|uniref:NERD domain-containing protein n=1 Tax=Actinoplanes couchii TaxID=403638 RepID=A0ABQ3XJF5_9ACTN|nr:hypothetical protein [Actinoplanes couchii]MDR6324388.1 hypothetical protein [Actinoplanes couchii]GID58612.1 hypothetical protein Aco03nite_070160 [Actinoplanes couchii]